MSVLVGNPGRKRIDNDYFGYTDEDPTARYHDEPDLSELDPVGDLSDDDFQTEDEDQ